MNPDFAELTYQLYLNNPDSVESCIQFIETDTDTQKVGQGRLRALMCRRLKRCTLSKTQKERLLSYVLKRLLTGNFSQQFKDELRLALFLDQQRTFEAAQKSLKDSRNYVRRYAEWVLAHR